jgi:hypothetical protein
METQKKIFSALAKKNKLSKFGLTETQKKINLGLVDDLALDAEYFDEQLSTAMYYADEQFDALLDEVSEFQMKIATEVDNLMVNSGVSQVLELAEQKIPLLQKLESLANDLGVEPTELYPDYETLNGNVMNAKEVMQTFYNKYDELVKTSGFLTDFS